MDRNFRKFEKLRSFDKPETLGPTIGLFCRNLRTSESMRLGLNRLRHGLERNYFASMSINSEVSIPDRESFGPIFNI